MRLAILAAVLLAGGCAHQQQKSECPTPAEADEKTAPTTPDEPLTDQLPATARFALAVRQSSFTSLAGLLTGDPPTRSELARYLTRSLGVDLTQLRGVLAFASSLDPPSGALLLQLPAPATPRGEAVGEHGGTTLVRLGGPDKLQLVGAAHPKGMVVGTLDAVRGLLDGAPPPSPDSPLAPMHAAASRDVGALAGLDASLLPPEARSMARRLGVTGGVLTFDRTRTAILRVHGDSQRLEAARKMLMAMLQRQLDLLEQRKQQATAPGSPVAAGVAAIASYHTLRRLLDEAQPRQVHGGLELRYQLPPADSAYLYVAVAGVLAAVAVPAFIKYVRKSKAVEAYEGLNKIAAAAKLYYEADRYDRRGRLLKPGFPPSVGWTPAATCCQQPGGKCQPDAAAFAHPSWRSLHFELVDPHYYQYRFESQGAGKKASFVAEARGDLDCDGTFSSFKLEGTVGEDGKVQVGPPVVTDELE